MLAGIGQHFTQHRQQVIRRLLRNRIVYGTLKREFRTDAHGRRKFIRQHDDSVTESSGQGAITKFEDRGADLVNGGVEVVHHLVDPLPYEVEIRHASCTLQGHADRKQTLHNLIVEIATDSLSVVEDAHGTNTVMQPSVLDRDACRQSEGFRESFILLCEVVCTDLVREIQIAEDFTPRPDWDSEKGLHRRMICRKSVAERMRAEFAQSKRGGVGDQEPEDASTRGTRADGLLFGLAQAHGQKLLETGPGLVQHTQSPVAGVDQRPGLFDQVTQQDGELEVRLDHQHGVHQATQLLGVADAVVRHSRDRTQCQ